MEKIKNKTVLRLLCALVILTLIGVFSVLAFTAFASENETELRINYCTLSFRDRVTVKYAVNTSGDTSAKLLIWLDDAGDFTYGTQKYTLKPVAKETIDGVDHLIFDFNDLAAKQMTDVVYAVACIERDGKQIYSAPNKYSILQYAYNLLGKTKPTTADSELRALLSDMLKYGSSAQLYFDYKETRLANADFYQVKLDGGKLDDGFNHGLFLEGEVITLTAAEYNSEGAKFTGWVDSTGKTLSASLEFPYTVGSSNATVLAMYDHNTDGIEFSLKTDGTYEVVGYNGTSKYLYIPESYEGKTVTSVKSNAIEGNKTVEYVSLPDTVTNVGNNAFKNCSKLKSVYLGNSLEVMGTKCLSGTAITELVIPDSVKVIGQGALEKTPLATLTLPFIGGSRTSSNAYLGYIFGGVAYGANGSVVPTQLSKVILSDAVTEIPAFAFFGCKDIASVIIGSSVEKIGINAFRGMSNMESIYLPESVVSVPADAEASVSPFYGCKVSLMIVLEKTVTEDFGKYWNYVTDDKAAFCVYMKTYDDYIKNGNSYRVADPKDANLSVLLVDGRLVDGFDPNVYSYTATADINDGFGKVSASAASASAVVSVIGASAENNCTATVNVISADGSTMNTYTVKFELTGSFATSAEVVNKNNAEGTVTFVIDDGDSATATFGNEMLGKYDDLKLTYALITNRLATLNTEYDSAAGKYKYVMTDDGRYTYTENTSALAFWRDILKNDRAEAISHTHTHAFPGINDDGGVQNFVNNSGNVTTSANLPIGSATAEIYAAIQILEELLGEDGRFLVEPGTEAANVDKTVDGVTYETYYTYYKALLNAAIADNTIVGGRGTVFQAGSSTDFTSRVVTKDVMADASVRNNIHAMMVRPFDNVSQWTTYVDNAIAQDGWAVFCIHKISESATSGHYILEDAAEELFSYAAAKNVWIANYTEASLYLTEWASASVSTSYTDGAISVTLTDNEDNAVFNEALTVKVSVPCNWSSAVAGGKTLDVMTDVDGSSYVLVDIVPDGGAVTVSAIG